MFKEWLMLETKFHNNTSMVCGHCDGFLFGLQITPNPKHIYTFGKMFKCFCDKSRVWTNSIRNEEDLLACFADPTKKYRRGFCNDTFCGFCFEYIQPLKNGFEYKGKRTDRYGCLKCKQNQMIIVNGDNKDPEGEESTNKLFADYKRKEALLKKAIDDYQ